MIMAYFERKVGFSLPLKIRLLRLITRTFEAKKRQVVSADAVFCFLNIFVEDERTNAE